MNYKPFFCLSGSQWIQAMGEEMSDASLRLLLEVLMGCDRVEALYHLGAVNLIVCHISLHP